MKKILFTGSINTDITVRLSDFPFKGGTVIGNDGQFSPGGKGLNQAVAAKRLGANVSLIGKVGNDQFGSDLINFLENEELDTTAIVKTKSPTGIGMIMLDTVGQNSIVYIPGANSLVTEDFISVNEELLKASDYVVSQLEIPVKSVLRLLELSRKLSKITVLNTAPYDKSAFKMLSFVDFLVVNEFELAQLAESETLVSAADVEQAAKNLLEKGPKTVVVTLGSRGVLCVNVNDVIRIDGIKVKVLDTTGAGDCFIGAFVTRLSCGDNLKNCLEFANKAAAFSVDKLGTATSYPYLKDLT